jgi:hypothetical protein
MSGSFHYKYKIPFTIDTLTCILLSTFDFVYTSFFVQLNTLHLEKNKSYQK